MVVEEMENVDLNILVTMLNSNDMSDFKLGIEIVQSHRLRSKIRPLLVGTKWKEDFQFMYRNDNGCSFWLLKNDNEVIRCK